MSFWFERYRGGLEKRYGKDAIEKSPVQIVPREACPEGKIYMEVNGQLKAMINLLEHEE